MAKELILSIIIVSYNVKRFLKECIESVYKTIGNVEYEVIVVDNGSSDSSVAMLREEFPRVKIIENLENRGFATANNQGINLSNGEYVLLLNPDTKVLPNALNTMLHFMDTHRSAGALGCKVLNPDGTLQSSCRNFPSLWSIFFESTGLHRLFSKSTIVRRHYLQFWNHDEIRKVDSVKGACLMVRQDTVKQVGLLDERFFLYREEIDWCKRIKERRWEVFFTPDAQVIHYGGKSSKQHAQRNLIELHKARQQYFRKHFGSTAAYISKLIFGLGILLRMLACIPPFFMGDEKKKQTHERFKLFFVAFKWYFQRS